MVLKHSANRFQGYAARGGLVPFVPFCATKASLLLATQIPQSGMRTSLSQSEREFVPFGYDIKEKNTTQGGVFSFMVHLNRLVNKKQLIIVFWNGVRQSKESHEP